MHALRKHASYGAIQSNASFSNSVTYWPIINWIRSFVILYYELPVGFEQIILDSNQPSSCVPFFNNHKTKYSRKKTTSFKPKCWEDQVAESDAFIINWNNHNKMKTNCHVWWSLLGKFLGQFFFQMAEYFSPPNFCVFSSKYFFPIMQYFQAIPSDLYEPRCLNKIYVHRVVQRSIIHLNSPPSSSLCAYWKQK